MSDLIYIQTKTSHAGRTEFIFKSSLGDIARRGFFEITDAIDPTVKFLIPVDDLKTGIRIEENVRTGIDKDDRRVRTYDEMAALLEPLRAECRREQIADAD